MNLLPGSLLRSQKGYIGLTVIAFLILFSVIIYPYIFPADLPPDEAVENEHYCRDLVDDPTPPIVEAPSYDRNQVLTGTTRQYKMIKEKVPIHQAPYIDPRHVHFFEYKDVYTNSLGEKFIIRMPKGEQGASYKIPSDVGGENSLTFSEYGLLFLFHTSDGLEPDITERIPVGDGSTIDAVTADIYKAVDTSDLPDWVLTCHDLGLSAAGLGSGGTGEIIIPSQESSPDKGELQMEWFLKINSNLQLQAWWVPHCKPAVYLYPEREQLVNVKVFPKGELGYTDPLYDKSRGWTVWAEPGGDLYQGSSILDQERGYDYLYYESKIRDEAIKKPEKGWVVGSEPGEMGELFDEVLPKLGLNRKEANDFKEYWLKTLPKSPYYFVGLIEKEQRDYLETLDVTPNPDTSIRFSFYFEPLDQFKVVTEPSIVTPIRKGFTLVDWGGMIKLHKDTPFTCSQ